jgi:hypothetical protein
MEAGITSTNCDLGYSLAMKLIVAQCLIIIATDGRFVMGYEHASIVGARM